MFFFFLGFGILYLMFLTFILFQSYNDVREMMFYLDPSLKGQGPDTEVCVSTFIWEAYVQIKTLPEM